VNIQNIRVPNVVVLNNSLDPHPFLASTEFAVLPKTIASPNIAAVSDWRSWVSVRRLTDIPTLTTASSPLGVIADRNFHTLLGNRIVTRSSAHDPSPAVLRKTKLLGISKRGNPYLSKMFIHGARAAVLRVKREGSYLGQWISGLESRAARNVVSCHGEQAGQDQLGGVVERRKLSPHGSRYDSHLDDVS
jgi:hypothetical protein